MLKTRFKTALKTRFKTAVAVLASIKEEIDDE